MELNRSVKPMNMATQLTPLTSMVTRCTKPLAYGTAATHASPYGGAPVVAGTDIGKHHHHQEHHEVSGMLHRTSSSSSSSSEDDGHGGRRKEKGLREKIKEKIPGTDEHKHQEQYSQATSTTTPGDYPSAYEHDHEKKGIMDKIKEKLPDHHH